VAKDFLAQSIRSSEVGAGALVILRFELPHVRAQAALRPRRLSADNYIITLNLNIGAVTLAIGIGLVLAKEWARVA